MLIIIFIMFLFSITSFQPYEFKENENNYTKNTIEIDRFQTKQININNMEYLLIYGDLDTPPFVINLTNDILLNQYLLKQLNQ